MKKSLTLIGGERIESPKSDKTRPTTLMVRQAIFNILNKKVENSNCLIYSVAQVLFHVKPLIMEQKKLLQSKKTG